MGAAAVPVRGGHKTDKRTRTSTSLLSLSVPGDEADTSTEGIIHGGRYEKLGVRSDSVASHG